MKRSIFARPDLMFFTAPAEGGDGGDGSAPVSPQAPAGEPAAPAAEGGDGDGDHPGAEALGDPGKRALDAMKAKWKDAERVAREREAELADLRAKAEGREAEHAAQLEAQRIKDEALAAADERILKAEVRAAAAAKLADPTDALLYVDLSGFEVGDNGEVDAEAISAAIDDLLKNKPYLAAQGGPGPVFESPGSRREASKPQLAETDLASMTPDQINAARAEGRLNDLLGIK